MLRCDVKTNLARIEMRTGSYEKASALLNEVLKEQEQRISTEHPQFARTLSMLASLYHGTERAVTAEGLFRSSFEKWEARSGLEPLSSEQSTVIESSNSKRKSRSPRGLHPYEALEWMEAVKRYTDLLAQWEKREDEAKSIYKQETERLENYIRRNNARQYSLNTLAYFGTWRFGTISDRSANSTDFLEGSSL